MTEITIQRWKKYGHDRGYAQTPDGTKLGWVCLKTGDVHFETEVYDAEIDQALCAYYGEHGAPAAAADMEPTEDETAEPLELPPLPASEVVLKPAPVTAPAPDFTDLSLNRPGQAVREQAQAAWEADKQRSKILAYGSRFFDAKTDERAWRKGAEGEEFVGPKLDKLKEHGWYVLHSVPVGKGESDIDHVVIGPGGVFTINTKMHSGKKIWVSKYQMRVNGQPVPYLRNSRYEAARASRLLAKQVGFPVPAMGVVVVLTGTLIPEVTYRDMPDDVRVLDKWDIPKWFRKRAALLSEEQVEAVYEAARRSTTWQ